MALVRLTRKQPRIGYAALPETIGWNPPMDIAESATEIMLTAELAGMDQKDIDISIEDGMRIAPTDCGSVEDHGAVREWPVEGSHAADGRGQAHRPQDRDRDISIVTAV